MDISAARLLGKAERERERGGGLFVAPGKTNVKCRLGKGEYTNILSLFMARAACPGFQNKRCGDNH